MKTKHWLQTATALASLLTILPSANANIIGAQLDASDGGISNTIGGDGGYNLYFSQDNGLSFINTGDGPETSINLSTATPGNYTYQFYDFNGFAEWVHFQLFLGSGTIAVGANRDSAGNAFFELSPGSSSVLDAGKLITLTSLSFTNGSGPANDFFVTPGANYTPQVLGQFSYQVTTTVAAPATLWLFGPLLAGLGLFGQRSKS